MKLHSYLALSLLVCVTACAGTPAEPVVPVNEASINPDVNARFMAEDLDVEQFVKIFEGESREIAVHRDAIVAALDIEPGMAVADIGAGTGLFLETLSNAVGETGHLYAVDISPNFLTLLRERIRVRGFSNAEAVLCTERSAELAPSSVDLIFVCDTYHHFEFPQTTLASLRSALRPGGSLVVVDFDRIPGVSSDWILNHVRASREEFTAEIVAAGFVLQEELELPLTENYALRFRSR